jgi:hypothetical protein
VAFPAVVVGHTIVGCTAVEHMAAAAFQVVVLAHMIVG